MGYVDYVPDKNDTNAFTWCINNNIRIYPKPLERGLKNKLYYICIEINKKETCGKDTFENNELTGIIYEYYRYYYQKYKK